MSLRSQRIRAWLGTRPAKILLFVFVLLVAARVALPYVIKTVVNDRLAHMDGYRGSVLDVDVALWRGAYVIRGLVIEQIEGDVPVPFVVARKTDVSLEWLALLRGEVVAEIMCKDPVLNFVVGRSSQTGAGNDWRDVVDDLVPITISHFAIHRGSVHYRDYSASPDVDVELGDLDLEATGLSTVHDAAHPLPARIDANGTVQHSGALQVMVRLDPWSERPNFDLDLAMDALDARALNDLLRAYAGVDAEAGHFFLYSELRSTNGQFSGYVTPMVEGLSLFRFGEGGDAFDQLGDLAVQLFVDVFENHGTDCFATRIPVAGSFDAVDTDEWEAVVGVLSNTFIRAIRHGVERPSANWHADRSIAPTEG